MWIVTCLKNQNLDLRLQVGDGWDAKEKIFRNTIGAFTPASSLQVEQEIKHFDEKHIFDLVAIKNLFLLFVTFKA